MPLCNIGLNLEVNGNGTFVVTNPEKCQLIHPPMTIMGKNTVRLPFSMSVIMLGSVMGLGGAAARFWFCFKIPVSSLLN